MRAVLLCYLVVCGYLSHAQSGQWTWIHGYNTLNGAGVFGTQTVADPNNKPPALWSGCYWTDNDGNFWLFGGLKNGYEYAALWKYNSTSNMWTWIKGPSSTSASGVYGTQGVPSTGNYPGSRAWGICSWTDSDNNLWLFGGQGRDHNGDYGHLGDVWKYSIATNEWTWMAGSNNTYPAAQHGTLQIASATNTPGGRISTHACWIDADNNLWFFGGAGILIGIQFSDVWKFDPSVNQWTWMKGPATTNEALITGPVGVFGSGYTPGGRSAYSSWKDQSGKFWLFGGIHGYSDYYADMWAFDPVLLQWAFMGGSTTPDEDPNSGNLCEPSVDYYPAHRYQNTACWVDQYGRFWHFGGFNLSGTSKDLWSYDPLTLEWTWVSGSLTSSSPGTYGTLGVADPSNMPYGSGGSASWYDHAGNLYMYGGYTYIGANGLGDLWKYTIDFECPETEILPVSLIQFKASIFENNSVLLEWSTASEMNNHSFSVEHSDDGEEFHLLHVIPSAGNSSIIQDYSLVDKKPLQGINYYRLKQTDIDGTISYSPVRSVIVNLSIPAFSVQNPAINPITINVQIAVSKIKGLVLITDLSGKLLHQLPFNEENFVLPYLTQGAYFISVRGNSYSNSMKLVVQE